jgi:hypothetical protein
VGTCGGQDPEFDPEFGRDDGAVPEPAGAVPPPDPLPMSGQLRVDPDPDPELEPEELPDEPELVLPDPELPVLVPDDGVVVDELELVPELPVLVEVVAALAASAPPVTRPAVSAPTPSMLRRRSRMGVVPFIRGKHRPARAGITQCVPDLRTGAH